MVRKLQSHYMKTDATPGTEQPAQLYPDWPLETWRTVRIDEISIKARHLLKILRNLCRKHGKPYCYVGIGRLTKWMADDVGVTSERQVKRYIAELRQGGWLKVEKRGVNFYFPDMSPRDKMSPPMSPSASPSMSPSASPPIDTKDNKEPTEENSSNSAASTPRAAAVFRSAEKDEEEAPLIERAARHLGHALADRLVRNDLQLAEVVLAWFEGRLRDAGAKPVNNPGGLLRRALERPEECGFTRDGERWRAPKAGNLTPAQRQRDQAAEAIEIWNKLDPQRQASIGAHVEKTFNLTPGSSAFVALCAQCASGAAKNAASRKAAGIDSIPQTRTNRPQSRVDPTEEWMFQLKAKIARDGQ